MSNDPGGSLERVRQVAGRLIGSGIATSHRDGTRHELFPVAIDPQEGQALRDWVMREAAATTIEVGLGYGIATLFICEALLTNGCLTPHHVALDPNQSTRFSGVGLQAVEEAGVTSMVEFVPELSEIALPRFLSEGRRFDFAFVDGNHRFDGIFVDLLYLGRLVRGGGVIFIDDYQLASARKALRFYVTNLGWRLEEEGAANEYHHWAVVRTATTPLERSFDHFIDF